MKSIYVKFIKNLKSILIHLGILRLLERHLSNPIILYIRSLFAIYDMRDLIYLDLPWWTFKSIKFVDKYIKDLNGKVDVFEYGPGASTIWLAKRCKSIIFVEHDRSFFKYLRKFIKNYKNIKGLYEPPILKNKKPKNFSSQYKGYKNHDFENYVKKINEINKKFDIIIIDGRSRTFCLKESLKHLKHGGIILFDNTNRYRYKKVLKNNSFTIEKYRGMAPSLPYLEETSIIQKI